MSVKGQLSSYLNCKPPVKHDQPCFLNESCGLDFNLQPVLIFWTESNQCFRLFEESASVVVSALLFREYPY